MPDLQAQITELWDRRRELTPDDHDALAVVREAVALLDCGEARVADVDPSAGEPDGGSPDGGSPDGGNIVVHIWLKQAILLLFRLSAMETMELGPFEFADRIPLKRGWVEAGVRVVPGASARWGSFIEAGAVLMPSYVNIGARVGANTMVDTWATVGSCAQVGANVHLSGGVGIGGVLEPPQAAPVIIGDDVLVGSRCMITEGAQVGRGSVLGAGLILSRTIPVIDAETGDELGRGQIPPWCVAVSATRPRVYPGGEFGMPCALVIRRLVEGERHDKGRLEDLLRHHGVSG